MSEFFRPCWNFSAHTGIFPAVFPFSPPYMPAKIPSLPTHGIPAYLMQENVVGDSTNIPVTAEGIIRRM